MKMMVDVRRLLRRFGIIVYTGNKIADLDLITFELDELFKSGMIELKVYQEAKLIVRKERNYLEKDNRMKWRE